MKYYIIPIITVILLLLVIAYQGNSLSKARETIEYQNELIDSKPTITVKNVTDTIYITETLQAPPPKPKEIKIIDTVYIEQPSFLLREYKTYTDSVKKDNLSIIYSASISGIDPKLEDFSADVSVPIQTISTNVTSEIINVAPTKKKKLKLNLNPTLAGGWDIINQRPTLLVGVGLTLDKK